MNDAYADLKKTAMEKLKFHLQNSDWKLDKYMECITLNAGGTLTLFSIQSSPAYDSLKNPSRDRIEYRCGEHLLLESINDGYGNTSNPEIDNLFYTVLQKLKKQRMDAESASKAANLAGVLYAVNKL